MAGIYTKLNYLLLFFILGFAATGCKTSKDKGLLPTYVHVDSFAFTSVPAGLHNIATTHNVNSVWAYYNNSPIGVFDLPANIPVITNGVGVLTLKPGIAISGLNNFMSPYPFYISDTSSLVPQPGHTIQLLA